MLGIICTIAAVYAGLYLQKKEILTLDQVNYCAVKTKNVLASVINSFSSDKKETKDIQPTQLDLNLR